MLANHGRILAEVNGSTSERDALLLQRPNYIKKYYL